MSNESSDIRAYHDGQREDTYRKSRQSPPLKEGGCLGKAAGLFAALIVVVVVIQYCGSNVKHRLSYGSPMEAKYNAMQHKDDGDTFMVNTADRGVVKISLHGIMIPKKGQPGREKAENMAKGWLSQKQSVLDYPLKVYTVSKNPDGTVDALVFLKDGRNVGSVLVVSGMAWVKNDCKVDLCEKWRSEQGSNKRRQYGLWEDKNAVAPWEWEQAAPPKTKSTKGK